MEDENSPYENLIVDREDNRNDKKAKESVQFYQSPEVENATLDGLKAAPLKGGNQSVKLVKK